MSGDSTQGDVRSRAAQRYEEAQRLSQEGAYRAAREAAEQACLLLEASAEEEPLVLARALRLLATLCSELGQFEPGRLAAERAHAIHQAQLGAADPETLACLHLLGELTFEAGEIRGGRALLEEAFTLRREALGAAHPDTLESMGVHAFVELSQGNQNLGARQTRELQELCDQGLDPLQPQSARILGLLGPLWYALDEYSKAMVAYEQALAMAEALLGPEHLRVGRIMSTMAIVVAPKRAHRMLQRALEIYERTIGLDNLYGAIVLDNIAHVYVRHQKYAQALPYRQRALATVTQSLGPLHPQTLIILRNLVVLLEQLDDRRATLARIGLHRVLVSLEAATGMQDPNDQLSARERISAQAAADLLRDTVARMATDPEALPVVKDVEAEVAGARALMKQARALLQQGDYAQAEAALEQALATQQRLFGADHLDHVKVLELMVEVKQAQPNAPLYPVLQLQQRIVDIYLSVLGPTDPRTVAAMSQAFSRVIAEATDDKAKQTAAQDIITTALSDPGSLLRPGPAVPEVLGTLRGLFADRAGGEPNQLDRLAALRRRMLEEELPPAQAALVAGVEEVDWRQLHHPHGTAEAVPQLLRLLLSDDDELRDMALDELGEVIYHRESVCEVTPRVVPFLLRMLAEPATPGRADLLYLLARLAAAVPWRESYAYDDDHGMPWRQAFAAEGRDLDAELREEHALVAAVRRELAEGLPIYLGYLEHEDEGVRESALALVSAVGGNGALAIQQLQQLLAKTSDHGSQIVMAVALHRVLGEDEGARSFWRDLVQGAEHEGLRLVAAAALIAREREQTAPPMVDALVGALRSYWGEEAWDSALSTALPALVQLGPERAVAALLPIFLDLTDPSEARSVAGVLLDLELNAGVLQDKSTARSWAEGPAGAERIDYWEPSPQPPRDPAGLSVRQRELLRALVGHDPLWRDQHNLLALYGLPAERDRLRQVLQDG